MLPGILDITKGINIYESFPKYKEKVKQYGAIAIEIEILV